MYQVEPYAITITLQFFNDKTWQVHMVALKTSTLTAQVAGKIRCLRYLKHTWVWGGLQKLLFGY